MFKRWMARRQARYDLKTAKLLRAASDYMQDHGYVQGRFGKDGGARCLIGALGSVEGKNPAQAVYISGWRTVRALEPVGGEQYLIRWFDGLRFEWAWDRSGHWEPFIHKVYERLNNKALELELNAYAVLGGKK